MKNIIVLIAVFAVLTGCSSEASRIADCEAKGVSRDACYLAEKQQQASDKQTAINASVAAVNTQMIQKAQSAHKKSTIITTRSYKGNEFVRGADGIAYLNGVQCPVSEKEPDATVYKCNKVVTVIVYEPERKVAVMVDGVFKGYMK